MASEYGESSDYEQGDAPTTPDTMRGRDWPALLQFCVFLENQVGRLNDLLRCLEGDDLRVIGMSVLDAIDVATVRLIVSEVERARERLELGGFMFTETHVIGVELPDDPQPLRTICAVLMRGELNVHYAYPLLYRRKGSGGIVVHVDDIDQALEHLGDAGLQTITEDHFNDDDEHLYR